MTKRKKAIKNNEITGIPPGVGSMLIKTSLVGLLLTLAIGGYAYWVSRDIFAVMMIIGGIGFMPLGMVLGAMVFDKYLRCKVFRALFKKNLGIMNIVDGKEMYSKIMNFEHDIVEDKKGKKIYYLKKSKMYSDKGEPLEKIDQETVKFQAGIPTMYFDINNMIPLSFHKDKTNIQSEQLAAILKAHSTTQEIKLVGGAKKKAVISIFVLIAIIGVAVYYSFNVSNMIQNEVIPLLNTLKAQGSTITQGG